LKSWKAARTLVEGKKSEATEEQLTTTPATAARIFGNTGGPPRLNLFGAGGAGAARAGLRKSTNSKTTD
jgi:hypothetical protein